MKRTDAILRAIALMLETRRASLDGEPLRSVLIEAKVNVETGEVRAALISRRKMVVDDRRLRVNSF